MIKGIQDIYYNVQDMDRAIDFYTKAFGMKVTSKSPYWTALDLCGTEIGLHWTEGGPVPSTPRDSHGANAGATLTLRSDNIPADRKMLEGLGAKILGELNQPWGQVLVFEDPDGNVLKLMNPQS
jgi:predicted enzyme related to lactoylglutathione lyase